MIDWHTHIGNYNNGVSYSCESVFKVLKDCYVSECWCAYLTPKSDCVRSAQSFAEFCLDEMNKAKLFSTEIGLEVHWLYWVDPMIISSLQDIFKRFPFEGLAVHPFHGWSYDSYNRVFLFASENKKPVFLHTGCSKNDNPLLFEGLFRQYQDVEVHLAHCKDPEPIIQLFSRYKNLYGDIAFCPRVSYEAICKAGYKDRMLFGTDFPITHWYHHYGEFSIDTSVESLTTSYKQTISEMNWYSR